MHRPVFSSKTPYSLTRSFLREAISRTRTLWSLEPVKYCSAAPNASGSTTRRSIWSPSWWSTEAFVSPWATISRTDGSVTNVLITRWGSVEVTRISMSFTVSRMRRRDPATSIRSAPPRAASASVTRAATARAPREPPELAAGGDGRDALGERLERLRRALVRAHAEDGAALHLEEARHLMEEARDLEGFHGLMIHSGRRDCPVVLGADRAVPQA